MHSASTFLTPMSLTGYSELDSGFWLSMIKALMSLEITLKQLQSLVGVNFGSCSYCAQYVNYFDNYEKQFDR